MSSLKIATGALAQLEGALAEAVAAARDGDPLAPLTVLVGQSLLKRYLPRMLARRGIAQLNVRYVLANQLAIELAAPAAAGADPRIRLSRDAERLLVREIAQEAGGYFRDIARGDGFADALGRLFRELEMGGFADAAALVDALLSADQYGNAEKFRALGELYMRYLDRRAGFATVADDYRIANVAGFEGPLLVYGLLAPSALQLSLIERIAAAADVVVFLPQSSLAADGATLAFRESLAACGADLPADPLAFRGSGQAVEDSPKEMGHGSLSRPGQPSLFDVRTLAQGPDAVPEPIAPLAAALFAAHSGMPLAGVPVALVSAPDTVREVWEAARACMRWAAEGIRFHEMAVVYRNRDPYRALVDEIFKEAGIETYLHDGRLFSTHPLGLRLLAQIDLAADGEFSRRKVMEFLTETRIPKATRDHHPRLRASEWESYTREAGVVAGIEQWRRRLDRLSAEKRSKSQQENFEWMASVADRIDALRTFVDELHADLSAGREDIATWAEHLAYVRRLAEKYADGLVPLLDALDDLKTLAAVSERVPFAVFCRAVRDDLESRDTSRVLKEPVREFGRRGVAVLDATSLRHLRFRAVHMIGVAERAWPPPPRPDPLLLEHERRSLNARGIGVLPLRTEPDDAPLTFWLAVQAARERLAVSYARADAGSSGKHLPSYFFRAVAEALAGERLDLASLDSSDFVQRLEAGRLAHDDLGASLSDAEYDRGLVKMAIDAADPSGVPALGQLDAANGGVPWFARAIDAREGRWSVEHNGFGGVMLDPAAAAQAAAIAFARDKPVSPSRLEMWASCPQRYFLRYALGLQPVEEPEAIERLDPLARGSLIHAILERFLESLGRDDPPQSDARARHVAMLREVAADECRKREMAGVTGRPLIWAMDQKQIDDDLVRWYELEVKEGEKTAFRPGAFEVGFSGGGYGTGRESPLSIAEPLVVRAGGRELLFQGRIDRVDWDEARENFRVIDYKTGSPRDKAAFGKGRAMQLPIYLRAAAQALQIEPEHGEAQYFYVSSKGGFKRKSISGEELAARSADFEQVLTTVADGVDSGFFAPNPEKDRGNCMWCDFKDVCDAKIDRIAQRKSNDARGNAFRALQEIP